MSSITVNAEQYAAPIGPRNDLLTRVQAYLERYVAFANEHHSRILSLWVLHTHAFDASYVTPYLYISSVDPGAGKTTLLETLGDVARNPVPSANISASYLFRKIDAENPTLFIDEVDTIYSGSKNEELRSVLNSGYLYNGKTSKTVQGEPTDFSTFCPKALGGIDNGALPETVADRCIRIRLRKLSGDALALRNIQRRNIKRIARDSVLADLKHDLARWATVEMIDRLGDIEPSVPEGLSARQWDIAEPLVQIAIAFGAEAEARESINAIFQGEKADTPETIVLRTARDLFDETGADRITNNMLAEATGYTPDRVSRMLSPMGIKSRSIRVGGGTVRGYYRPEFEAAWERFI
jgi:hypothetical protein